MPVRFELTDVVREIELGLRDGIREPIERAATLAIRQGGQMFKTEVRSSIASAGFSTKWQNAWRVETYPRQGYSARPAIFGYHKIGYSGIFETGGTIRAKSGLLWIPLPTVPKLRGGRRPTPRELEQRGVDLFTMKKTRTGRPIIGTAVRLPKRGNASSTSAVRMSRLIKGVAGKRGTVHAVPLYFGIDSVTIEARFQVYATALSVQERLALLYYSNVRDD